MSLFHALAPIIRQHRQQENKSNAMNVSIDLYFSFPRRFFLSCPFAFHSVASLEHQRIKSIRLCFISFVFAFILSSIHLLFLHLFTRYFHLKPQDIYIYI